MCITEYNEEKTLTDEREEGRMEGRLEGILVALIGLAKKGVLSEERAAQEAQLPVDEFRRLVESAAQG